MKGHMRRPAILAGLLAACFAVAGVAYATIPGSDHVYQACMQKENGKLRLIDPSLSRGPLSRCTKAEVQVSWNQVGPQGAQGPTGPTGAQGPKGDPGDAANLVSPNGQFRVDITNHGVYLRGPSGTVYVNRFKAAVSSDPNFER